MTWLSNLWLRLRGLSEVSPTAESEPPFEEPPFEVQDRDTPVTVRLSAIEPRPLAAGMITEHFSWGEMGCRDGTPVPQDLRVHALELCRNLEVLRAELRSPIRIISGLRTPAWNDKVKGATLSQHLLARAADIRVRGVTPPVVHATVVRLIARGQMKEGGLGLYLPRSATDKRPARLDGWVHYDCRGTRARWVG